MKEEKGPKAGKSGSSQRRRLSEPSQFESEITLQLDEFFRHFNYYYPYKNKEEIITKCITGNAYWITLDSQFYPDSADLEAAKIAHLRTKATLKNGAYPPTKDCLQEEKFILKTRSIASRHFAVHLPQQLRKMPLPPLLSYFQELLLQHEAQVTHQIDLTLQALTFDNEAVQEQLRRLGIPLVKSARLFAYEKLEKEVIQQLVEKSREKELQPRCDFCFTRDKQIVKCKSCDLFVHPLCFPKAAKQGQDFTCDQCSLPIPENAQCELCPLQGGHFLEISDSAPLTSYQISKGQTNLRFRVSREQGEGKARQFIHISCFVLHPECSYNQARRKVEGVHHIDRSRKNTGLCLICGNMIGLTVPCTNESCRRAYHPECAKRNHLKINVIKANNKSLLQIYCDRHKKPESYEYLNDSVSNRIKELRRFYESLDHEIKRHGNNHGQGRPKRQTKAEDNLKADLCLACSQENTFDLPILNCHKCYGWRHLECSPSCPLCEP